MANNIQQIRDHQEEKSNNEKIKIVFFDLETSGLSLRDDILQIAARHNESEFSKFIMPNRPIDPEASRVNGLIEIEGNLYFRGQSEPLPTEDAQFVIKKFIEFLKSIGPRILLAAHNCYGFDAPRIIQLIEKTKQLDDFQTIVVGFVDTIPPLRKKLLKRRLSGGKFTLQGLAADYLSPDERECPHEGLGDVRTLEKLLRTPEIDISDDELRSQFARLKRFISC